MLTIDTRTPPHPDVVVAILPNSEAVLLHIGTKTYYSLNETGSLIWQGMEKRLTLGEIAGDLARTFDLTVEAAGESVLELAGELLGQKLIVIGS